MGQELFLSFLPVVIGLTFVGLIALGISAITDGKHEGRKDTIVRRLYVYLVSFTTLLLVALAVGSLLDLGLRSAVFTKADPTPGYYNEPPPGLYWSSGTVKEPVPESSGALSCDNGCTLTDEQKTEIANWETNYANWKNRQSLTSRRAQALITPLSFLVIAGIVFFIHWRFVLRDRRDMGEGNMTRATYFNAMSFIWLVMSIVVGALLLTTVLKAFIPGGESTPSRAVDAIYASSDRKVIKSLTICSSTCGLSGTTADTAQEWLTEYDAWTTRQDVDAVVRQRHNNFAVNLSFLLVAVPLFWYHFRTAWGERGKGKLTIHNS